MGKSKKGERLDSFTDRLMKIRHFIEYRIDDDWKRSLVCGVFFLPNGLAMNIQQLRMLLGRCKSSINGSLQQLGYMAEPQSQGVNQEFVMRIPARSRDANELKKWTIRRIYGSAPEAVPPSPAFIIPIPIPWTSAVAVDTEAVHHTVEKKYPCPVKCRYKYYDMAYQSVSIQTEV
jgi:hypothetical protein